MNLIYKIEELVDSKNQNLFNEIKSKTNIELINEEGDSWTSKLYNEKATIGIKKSEYPIACFTHELLHIKYELLGMKCPFFVDEENIGAEMIGHLYNEFCHHRFYKEFIELGFEPEQFLNDYDKKQFKQTLSEDIPKLEKVFKKNKNIPLKGLMVALPYLMYLSPNQVGLSKPKKIERLENISSKDFIRDLESLIIEVTNSNTYDLSKYFAKFFKLCNKPKIGFSLEKNHSTLVVAGNV